jgi:hypothetical protein
MYNKIIMIFLKLWEHLVNILFDYRQKYVLEMTTNIYLVHHVYFNFVIRILN